MSESLDAWIADLQKAAEEVDDKAERVVSKGALNIKDAWRARWAGHRRIADLPAAISYDITRTGAMVSAEIGPDKNRRQGPLGNLVEFGSVNNAPIPGGLPALQLEEPKFARAVEDLGDHLLDER